MRSTLNKIMEHMFVIIVLILICVNYTFCSFMKNSYSISLETVKVCPDNDKNDAPLRNLKLIKINRTHHTLSYDVTYPYAMDEKVGADMIVQKWTEGRWKQMPFIPFQSNACRMFLSFFRTYMIAMHAAMGVKNPDKCPIPARNYSLKNYVLDMSSLSNLKNIPFWSGRFQFVTMTKRTDTQKTFYCNIYIINLEEQF